MQETVKKVFFSSSKAFNKYNVSFDELLDKIATGFEFGRYVFEDKNRVTEAFGKDFPFAYSEGFLQYFFPIISRIATNINKSDSNKD